MRKKTELEVERTAIKDLTHGDPLILKETAVLPDATIEEGSLLHLVDKSGGYIATGYSGIQSTGIGWVLSRKEKEQIGVKFVTKKIREAAETRAEFFASDDTSAFRVFNGEGDGIGGLTIDFFNGFYMVSWYSEGIYSFRHDIYEALNAAVNTRGIYEKLRFNTNGQYIDQDDYVSGEKGEFPLIVQENGMNFAVDLNDGAMTGIFLDQRNVRKALRDRYSADK